MTRKRTRECLGRTLHEPCFYCDGTGQLQSKPTIAYEILRQIRRERDTLPGYKVVVNAHPAVVRHAAARAQEGAVDEARARFMRQIVLVKPATEYHLEQFDLQGQVSRGDVMEDRRSGGATSALTINKEFESFDAFIQEYVTNISRTGVFMKTRRSARRRHRGEPRSP